jgi:hypothetical protein
MNDQRSLESPGRNLRARDAVEALRSSLSNAQIMKRFKISALGFADLLRQLFERGFINEQDLVQRGIRYHVVKRESVLIDPEIPELLPSEDSMQFLDTVELIEILTLPEFPNK